VFCSTDGKPIDPDNFAHRDWARVLRRAELRRIRFHDLRHTYASLLIAQGAQPKYIQAQLGHASIQTTFDRYGHLMPGAHAGEARKLDRLVFGENGHHGAGCVIADAVQRLQNGCGDDEGASENSR
jgi:integrase